MAHEIRYAMFGRPNPPGHSFPLFESHYELKHFVRAAPASPVLISYEGLSCFNEAMTEYVASEFADLPVQVIFYIRSYRKWIESSYKFDVRIGANGSNFDAYLADAATRISALPMLESWAKVIGWERLRIRSLEPADLEGGDLIQDGFAAIGLGEALDIASPDAPLPHANQSVSWIATELMRGVKGDPLAPFWTAEELEIAHRLHSYADEAIAACGQPSVKAIYLSRNDATRLVDLYNRDIAVLSAKIGRQLCIDEAGDIPDRPFLPSIEHVPPDILRVIREIATDRTRSGWHRPTVNFLDRLVFNRLL